MTIQRDSTGLKSRSFQSFFYTREKKRKGLGGLRFHCTLVQLTSSMIGIFLWCWGAAGICTLGEGGTPCAVLHAINRLLSIHFVTLVTRQRHHSINSPISGTHRYMFRGGYLWALDQGRHTGRYGRVPCSITLTDCDGVPLQ